MPQKKFPARFGLLLAVTAVCLTGITGWIFVQIQQTQQKHALRTRLQTVLNANKLDGKLLLGKFERFDASNTRLRFVVRIMPSSEEEDVKVPAETENLNHDFQGDPFFHDLKPARGINLKTIEDIHVVICPAPNPERIVMAGTAGR